MEHHRRERSTRARGGSSKSFPFGPKWCAARRHGEQCASVWLCEATPKEKRILDAPVIAWAAPHEIEAKLFVEPPGSLIRLPHLEECLPHAARLSLGKDPPEEPFGDAATDPASGREGSVPDSRAFITATLTASTRLI